jgi:hypothetical protein
MHIHPSAVGQHSINTGAAGNERAATAQRAAEVRKRLLKSAQMFESEAASDPDATLFICQWSGNGTGQGLDSRHSQALPDHEDLDTDSGKDPDLG